MEAAPSDFVEYDHGVVAIDSGYLRPRLDAIHLVVEQGRAAFIDTGTNASLPRMLEALRRAGLGPDAVDYVILTHVHLDHAGGAGALMQACRNARLVVHPRGAPHMIDPSRLWAGTVAVYGEERARHDYGELVPVPTARVLEAPDRFAVSLAGRELQCIDTPGHARHHLCVRDTATGDLFTGDTFGLSYRELDLDGRAFIFPTTTPVQFDPEALQASIDRLLALKPGAIYLTHYSRVTDIPRLGADLHRLVDAHAELALGCEAIGDAGARRDALRAGVRDLMIGEARRCGGDEAAWQEVLSNDIVLNADGLESWLQARARGHA